MSQLRLSLIPMGFMLAFAVNADVASSPRLSAKDPELTTNVRDAIAGYVAACVSHDVQRLDSVTTEDVRLEYALDDPGIYLSVDMTSLLEACARGATGSRLASLSIFPTADANVVFVQYDLTAGLGDATHHQLALVEMRGKRISRMLNYSQAPQALIASAARTATRSATSVIAHSAD
jgi:hypothetical protein